jgi:hypothetical protein
MATAQAGRSLIMLSALFLTACVSAISTGNPTQRVSDRISREEFSGGSAQSAFEVVQSYRANWLQLRPSVTLLATAGGSVSNPMVAYLDNVPIGQIDALRSIPSDEVGHIELVSSTDATQRWGTGHPAGAILVVTRR